MAQEQHVVELPGVGPTLLTVDDTGGGHPVLVLHGGAGPRSVGLLTDQLVERDFRVVAPVHPGFDGTPRPDELRTTAGLALLYAQLLDDLDLAEVTVVGNSVGGWVAAELALLRSPRVARLVLLNAVGLDLPAHPIVDFFSLTMDQVFERSYFTPADFRVDLSSLSAAQQAVTAANRAALRAYGGSTMTDPTLRIRLPGISVPTLVVWGRADRIVPPEHGQAYADAIPGARLEIIETAGHLPQIETPGALIELLRPFLS